MAKYKVDITGVNTNSLKVLTEDEIKALFKKLKEGDKFARNDLVEGNLKLVLSIIRPFCNKTDNMDDLFQIGCVGLVKAIDNFDPSYDVKLSTYAVPMILGEVKRYIRDNSSVRVSRSIKDIAYKTLKLKDELTIKNGYEPTLKQISEILEIKESDIINSLDAITPPMSLEQPIYNDGGDTIYLYDQIEDKKVNNSLEDQLSLEKAISKLSAREQEILEKRYIIGKTQMEIAEEIGISQAQISRLEKNALTRVRKQL